jgi:Asp-tRNA(Asn)/Glu-tRNA(Gln) amidotransferase B subunit
LENTRSAAVLCRPIATKERQHENPKAVEDYRAGKSAAVQFLVGQVMKRTKGRAKPDAVQPILLGKLDQS